MKYSKIFTSLTFAGLLLSGCSKPSTEELLSEAKQQLSEGNDNQAVIILKNAIVEDGRQLEPRLLLAKIYLSSGDGLSAVKELKRSVKLGAKEAIVAGPMVEALFTAQEFQSLVDYVDELLPATRESQLDKFRFYQAFSYLELGKLEAARRLIERAPSAVDSEYTLATDYILALVTDDRNTLNKIGERIINVESVFADALWLVGKVSYLQENYPLAVKALSLYELRREQFLPASFLHAKALMQAGEVEEAQQKVDALIAAFPDEPVSNLLAATLAFQRKDYAKSFQFATNTIQISGNNAQSQLLAGLSAYFTGDMEAAFYYLDPIESFLTEGHVAKRVYLATLVKLKKNDKAFKVLGSKDTQDTQAAAIMERAGFQLLVSGEAEKGQLLLDKSASLNEVGSDSYYQGVAQILSGNENGLDVLKNLVDANPQNLLARLSVASVLITEQKFEQAEEYLEGIEDAEASNEQTSQVALQLKAQIAKARNLPEQMAAIYKAILEQYPANEEANLFFAYEALKQNDGKAAMVFVETVLADNPTNIQALLYGVASLQQMGEEDKIIPLLEKTSAVGDDDEMVRMMYAETLYRQGFSARALNELDSLYASFDSLSKRYWQLYAEVTKREKTLEDYFNVLRQWREAYPQDLTVHYRLIEFFLANRDFGRAKFVIDKALELAPNDTAIKLQLADWQIETRQIEEARLTLAGMKVDDVFATAKQGIEGKLDYFAGRYEVALPKVARFYADQPTTQYATLLRALYFKLDRKDDARAMLSQHVQNHPYDNVIRILLANDLYKVDPQRAIKLYEDSLSYSEDNEVVLFSLSRLAMEQEQHDKAIEYAGKLIELDNSNPKYLNLSGMTLLHSDQTRLAIKRLQQAYEGSNKNIIYAMDYAEGLLATGDKQSAIDVLEAISNPLPAFKRRIQAMLEQAQG